MVVALLEPGAEHGKVERLAEAAGAGQDDDLDAGSVEELTDQVGLVDVLEARLAESAEVVDADGDRAGHARRSYPKVAGGADRRRSAFLTSLTTAPTAPVRARALPISPSQPLPGLASR